MRSLVVELALFGVATAVGAQTSSTAPTPKPIAASKIASCVAVPNKIQAGTYVKSRDVRYCVEVFRNSVGTDSAVKFIRELQPLLEDRPQLEAELLAREANIQMELGLNKYPDAIASLQASLAVIEPVHLQVDLLRLTTLVAIGQNFFAVGQKKEFERYFLEALSYPWYTVRDHPEEMQQLRDQYVAAGRGLIDARRGDLKALKEIVFVPATYDALGPYLEKAINEAQSPVQWPPKNN